MNPQLKQILVIALIVIVALILLPFVVGILGMIIHIALFLAIVAAIYWAYVNYIRK